MSTANSEHVLQIEKLCVDFPDSHGGNTRVVDDVSLAIARSEVLAVVGESGSGKTMLARSILQLLPEPARISGGAIRFGGQNLCTMSHSEIRTIRGAHISMIFQEPMVSLNPCLKIGFQLCESMRHHTGLSDRELTARALELLTRLRLENPAASLRKYPHEFSGGMRQRIMIAASLMMQPQLLIADEPTTALDCLIQRELMDQLIEVSRDLGTSVLLISHDLGLVAHYASRVVVMQRGKVCEQGEVGRVLRHPSAPYTTQLLEALPGTRPSPGNARPERTTDAIVQVREMVIDYPLPRRWPFGHRPCKRVLHGVSLQVRRGETLAVVGESGSGKTTLGRALLQLQPVTSGSIHIEDHCVTGPDAPGLRRMSELVQLVFQDPYSSLSPRQRIDDIIAEPLRVKADIGQRQRQVIAATMAEAVGLPASLLRRYPNELSGGQRQRVAIARALVNRPRLVIADEPVSALDITIQRQILDLLQQLQAEYGFSCLFISHDLGVVREIADRVIVLFQGHIVEEGRTEDLFTAPHHPYTRQLLSALPRLGQGDGAYRLLYPQLPPLRFPEGYAVADTPGVTDTYLELGNGHRVACRRTPA